jgi:antirestriction protein ArdC
MATPRFLTFKQAIEAGGNVRTASTERRAASSNSYKSMTPTANKPTLA